MKPTFTILPALLAFSIFHFPFSLSGAPRPLVPIAAKLEPTRSLVYKSVAGRDLKLHIFEPPCHQPTDRRPAWISIHGGGWTGGNARVKYPFAHHFSQLGMVGMSIDYRLLKKPEGTTVFDCVKDGRSAIRYIRQHAAEVGIDSEPHRRQRPLRRRPRRFGNRPLRQESMNPADDLVHLPPFPTPSFSITPSSTLPTEGYGNEKDRLSAGEELSPRPSTSAAISPPPSCFHGTGDTVTPFECAKLFHEKHARRRQRLANSSPTKAAATATLIFDLALYRERHCADRGIPLRQRNACPAPDEHHRQPKAPIPFASSLPPELFAVAGVETTIHFDNAVLTETPEAYRIQRHLRHRRGQ